MTDVVNARVPLGAVWNFLDPTARAALLASAGADADWAIFDWRELEPGVQAGVWAAFVTWCKSNAPASAGCVKAQA